MIFGDISDIDISNIDISNIDIGGVILVTILIFDIGEVILVISVLVLGFVINQINYAWTFDTYICMSILYR